MFRHAAVRIEALAFTGIALLLVAGPARAQQGWPINGSNWSFTGGSRGSSSYSPSYRSSYSPSYYSGPAAPYGDYPFAALPANYYAGASTNGYTWSSSYYSPPQDNTARIRLVVPADAKVWFDDHATKQGGEIRDFVSPALEPDRPYVYEIKARSRDKDGQEVARTRRVNVSPNGNVSVDFTRQ